MSDYDKRFIKLGVTFKNKSGKSGTLKLNEQNLEFIRANMVKDEKYGMQASILITGTPDSEYGYSVKLIIPEDKIGSGESKVQESVINPDGLPF